jgi:DNA excision repair protein ERCC-4
MTRVVVDRREPREILGHLTRLGVAVQEQLLDAGDYELGGRALVERKTVRALHASVIQGRFWTQVGLLRSAARFPYVLIEGRDLDDGPLSPAAIRGICVALMDLGVGVVRSVDARDSTLWLQRLAERRASVRIRNAPAYAQRPKREAGFPAAEAALACVPGISRVCAQTLLAHFGSLAALVQASPAEWQRVRGIGPTKANAIAVTFHAERPASRYGRSPERRDPST